MKPGKLRQSASVWFGDMALRLTVAFLLVVLVSWWMRLDAASRHELAAVVSAFTLSSADPGVVEPAPALQSSAPLRTN